MGSPSIFVYDCSNAGLIVKSFKQFALQREQELEVRPSRPRTGADCPVSPRLGGGGDSVVSERLGCRGGSGDRECQGHSARASGAFLHLILLSVIFNLDIN